MAEARNRITIYFDGAGRNVKNVSSPMGIGIATFINKEYKEEFSYYGYYYFDETQQIRGTSNTAEWLACVNTMKLAVDLKQQFPDHNIFIFSDSQVISRQFNNEYQITDPSHQDFYKQAHNYAEKVDIKEVHWIRREHNQQADILSKKGIKNTHQINQIVCAKII